MVTKIQRTDEITQYEEELYPTIRIDWCIIHDQEATFTINGQLSCSGSLTSSCPCVIERREVWPTHVI